MVVEEEVYRVGTLADGVVTSQPGGPLGFTVYGSNNGAPAAQQGDGCGGGGGGAGGASPGPSARWILLVLRLVV